MGSPLNSINTTTNFYIAFFTTVCANLDNLKDKFLVRHTLNKCVAN